MAPSDFESNIFQKVINSLAAGILFCDETGIIRVINTYYAGLFGGKPEDFIGRPLQEFNPGTYAPRVMQTGVAELGDLCTLPLYGDTYKFVVNRIPLKDEKGRVNGMVSHIVFADPSELRVLNQKIESLSGELNFYKSSIHSLLKPRFDLNRIIGNSPVIQHVRNIIRIYAEREHGVLILGETGTGKELAANALHGQSGRSEGPFISINCAAVPKDLFEAELFGYAGGAFSGALKDGKAGQLELADKGTLFLDEVGDMPLHAQVKLLRVLEEKQVTRVGALSARQVDFRLLTATNKDLKAMVESGAFREDLYYRISTLSIVLPPLREREGDVALLSSHILSRIACGHLSFTEEALQAMNAYAWPGNVRQLYNALVHASIHCSGNVIDIGNLPAEISEPTGMPCMPDEPVVQYKGASADRHAGLAAFIAEEEADYLREVLLGNKWNITAAARQLGISRVTLYGKLKRYGITPDRQAGK